MMSARSSNSSISGQFLAAARDGNEAVVRQYVEKNKDNPNVLNEVDYQYGNTALMFAAFNGHEGIVKYLVSTSGINILCKNDSGLTAAMGAQQKGHTKIAIDLAMRAIRISAPTHRERLAWIQCEDKDIPAEYKDPISGQFIEDPVAAENGRTYSRSTLKALHDHLGNPPIVINPFTNQTIMSKETLTYKTHIITNNLLERFVADKEKEYAKKMRVREIQQPQLVPAQASNELKQGQLTSTSISLTNLSSATPTSSAPLNNQLPAAPMQDSKEHAKKMRVREIQQPQLVPAQASNESKREQLTSTPLTNRSSAAPMQVDSKEEATAEILQSMHVEGGGLFSKNKRKQPSQSQNQGQQPKVARV